MHATQSSLLMTALAAGLLSACASNGGADKPAAVAESKVQTAAPAAEASPAPAPAPQTNSRLVRPGQDPAQAGKGVDIRTRPPGFEPLEKDLETRAEARWKLLMEGKADEAYDYLTAGVRSSLDRKTYAADMHSRPIKWEAADAMDAQCAGPSCAVRVIVTFKFAMQSTGVKEMKTQAAITERWIKVADQWNHIPDQYLEGFAK